MSYPLFPQRRKLRKWIFALPRVRQQIDQRAIGNRLAPQIDKRAIDKGIAKQKSLGLFCLFVPSLTAFSHPLQSIPTCSAFAEGDFGVKRPALSRGGSEGYSQGAA